MTVSSTHAIIPDEKLLATAPGKLSEEAKTAALPKTQTSPVSHSVFQNGVGDAIQPAPVYSVGLSTPDGVYSTGGAKAPMKVFIRDNKFSQSSDNILLTQNIESDSAKKIDLTQPLTGDLTLNYNYYTNTIETYGENCKEEIERLVVGDEHTWSTKQGGVTHSLTLGGNVGVGWENIKMGDESHCATGGVVDVKGNYTAKTPVGGGNLYFSTDAQATVNPLSTITASGTHLGVQFGNSDNNISLGVGAETYDKSTPVYDQSFTRAGLEVDVKAEIPISDSVALAAHGDIGYGAVNDTSSSNYRYGVENGVSFKGGVALKVDVTDKTVWTTGVDFNHNHSGQNYREAYTMVQYSDGQFGGMIRATSTTDTTDRKRKDTIAAGCSYVW